MKVALVYDRINKWGGAERILLLLHEMFPDAPVYSSVYDASSAPWAKELDIRTSFLERIPFARSRHEFFALLMPIAFESFDFDEYDVVISLTSEAGKGILTKPHTKHICLCLTPTRYLWSAHKTYFPDDFWRLVSYPFVQYLRVWDKIAATRPDTFLAISKTVQDRISKYYQRDSEIIYPPLLLENPISKVQDQGYFLVVSRLSRFTPHKMVEIAIQAANKLKLQLMVVGDGDILHFKEMSGKTVKIVGKVTDEKLSWYYANCTALIFPGIEDFGLVMVEAQAAGKPVIAYKEGGAVEIVREGKTGEFFDRLEISSLVKTLKLFDSNKYNSKDCITNAKRFDKKEFKKKMLEAVHNSQADDVKS